MRNTKLLVVIFVGLLAWPGIAQAGKPSKELTQELQGYADQAREAEKPRATMYAEMADGALNGRKAAAALGEQAKDADPHVRLGAAMGLVLAGAPKATDGLVAELKEDAQLYVKLSEIVRLLPDKDEVAVLKGLLKAAAPAQRRDVLRYVAAQHGALYEVLGDALSDKDAQLRAEALEATLFTARDAAVGLAERMLKNKDAAVQADGLKLAIGLSERPGGSGAAVALLESALGAKSAEQATQAARQLVKLGKPRGAEFLGATLAKAEGEAQLTTAQFLLEHNARIATKDAEALLKAENERLKQVGWQLTAASGEAQAVDKLVEMFASTHFEERIIAVNALGYTRAPKVVTPLSGGLFEGNRDIRLGSARALGQLADASALGVLEKAMGSERDPEIKVAIVEAIGRVQDPRAIQLLRFQSTAREPAVKLAVVRGLRAQAKPDVLPALKVLQNDRDLQIQWLVFLTTLELAPAQGAAMMAQALRNPPDEFMDDILALKPATRDQLLKYLLGEGTPEVRAQALTTALRIGEPLLGMFRELAGDNKVDDEVRRALLTALADRKDAADKVLFERLARAGDKPALQKVALAALIELGSEDLDASFRGLLASNDPVVRAQAALGLVMIHR